MPFTVTSGRKRDLDTSATSTALGDRPTPSHYPDILCAAVELSDHCQHVVHHRFVADEHDIIFSHWLITLELNLN